jgi:hypothetical protein
MTKSHGHHNSLLYYKFLLFYIIKLKVLKSAYMLIYIYDIVFMLFIYICSVIVIIILLGLYNNDELIFLLKLSLQHFEMSSLIVIICYNYSIIISSTTLFYT